MKAILKIAKKAISIRPISYRGRRAVQNSSPGYVISDPISNKENFEESSLRIPSVSRGIGVETIGLGVRKAIHPSIAKNRFYQRDKYGD